METTPALQKYLDVYDAVSPTKLSGVLEGKVAFVTGAGRGIGKAIALALAQAGAHVALLSRTESQLASVADTITTQFNRKALIFPVDASDVAAVTDAFQTTERELGKVDIVVPNAAINIFRPLVDTPFEDWWRLMEINVKGPIALVQLAMRSMRERNEGAIIVISSRAAIVNIAGPSGYCTSKAALLRAVGCLQLELDAEQGGNSGVHMYTLHPGGVKTDMTLPSIHPDMERLIPGFTERITSRYEQFRHTPELCAQLCVYLSTGLARSLRGRYIDVENDIEALVKNAELIKKNNLYDLRVNELGE